MQTLFSRTQPISQVQPVDEHLPWPQAVPVDGTKGHSYSQYTPAYPVLQLQAPVPLIPEEHVPRLLHATKKDGG